LDALIASSLHHYFLPSELAEPVDELEQKVQGNQKKNPKEITVVEQIVKDDEIEKVETSDIQFGEHLFIAVFADMNQRKLRIQKTHEHH
jgi:hypothetical protein